jgi:hypothetical protein
MMNMLTHGAQYVIYAPYIQRIINFKTEMEFGFNLTSSRLLPFLLLLHPLLLLLLWVPLL